jgi:dihydroxy-acid dehydratase
MKYLMEHGLLNGECLTVTGKTMAENLAGVAAFKQGQDVIRSLDNPIKPTGHLRVLRGNLAPGGAVAKITGKEGEHFSGPARVFNSEEDMLTALERSEIKKGDVVVIRYEGPKGRRRRVAPSRW